MDGNYSSSWWLLCMFIPVDEWWVAVVGSWQKTRENNHDLTTVYMQYIKSINATNLGHFINSYIRHVYAHNSSFVIFFTHTLFLTTIFRVTLSLV